MRDVTLATQPAYFADHNHVEVISPQEATILYVDDQPSHRLLFERVFRGDYLVLTAATAEEGLKIIQEHEVFLVVADLNMPQVTGIDFLEKAKGLSPRSVRAILTAYSSAELKNEASRRADVEFFFEKPWDRKKFRGFIEEAFLRYATGVSLVKEQTPDLQQIIDRANLPSSRMTQLISDLEEKVDAQGSRRIFLTFSLPRLKDFVAVIRRPTSESWARAVIAAVEGRPDLLETALQEYLKT